MTLEPLVCRKALPEPRSPSSNASGKAVSPSPQTTSVGTFTMTRSGGNCTAAAPGSLAVGGRSGEAA